MTSEVMPADQKSWAETPPMNPPLRYAIGNIVERQTWLDKLAAPFQDWLLKLFGQPGQPNRDLAWASNTSRVDRRAAWRVEWHAGIGYGMAGQ